FNSGEYDSEYVQKLLNYCKQNLNPSSDDSSRSFGHWHYSHYYYAQVMYRIGGDQWKNYFPTLSQNILRKQSPHGSWKDSHVGPVYTTAMNCTILQLENGYLPIYQR